MFDPILIGMTGKARSGKDTFANMVEGYAEDHGLTVGREAFARRLKESAAHALGVFENEVEFCDKLKGDYERGFIEVRMATKGGGPNTVVQTVTGREFLQYYGTEAHRDVFNKDFWVDAVLPYDYGDHPRWWDNFRAVDGNVADICIVTDVRFANEGERIKQLGGYVWEVVRDGAGAGGHASEAGLPPEYIDLVIDNNGTFDSLKDSAQVALEDVLSTQKVNA